MALSEKEIKETLEFLTLCEIAYDEIDPESIYIEYNECAGLDEFRKRFNKHFVTVFDNLIQLSQTSYFVDGIKRFLSLDDPITTQDGHLVSRSNKMVKFFNLIENKYFDPREDLNLYKLGEPYYLYQWNEILRLNTLLQKELLINNSNSQKNSTHLEVLETEETIGHPNLLDKQNVEYFKLEPNIKNVTAYKLALSAFFETCLHEDYSKAGLAKFFDQKFKLKDEYLGTESLRIALGNLKNKKLDKKDSDSIQEARGLLLDAIKHLENCKLK